MKQINVRFDIGEKIWFYIPLVICYAWGIIESINYFESTSNKNVEYRVPNRFYIKNDECYRYRSPDFFHQEILVIPFDKAYRDVRELKDKLTNEYIERIAQAKEVKRSIFGKIYEV